MSNRFSLIVAWLVIHRSQIQILMMTIVLLLFLVGALVPTLRLLAEDAGGGGH